MNFATKNNWRRMALVAIFVILGIMATPLILAILPK